MMIEREDRHKSGYSFLGIDSSSAFIFDWYLLTISNGYIWFLKWRIFFFFSSYAYTILVIEFVCHRNGVIVWMISKELSLSNVFDRIKWPMQCKTSCRIILVRNLLNHKCVER